MLNSAQLSPPRPPSPIMLKTNKTNLSATNMKIFTLWQQNSQNLQAVLFFTSWPGLFWPRADPASSAFCPPPAGSSSPPWREMESKWPTRLNPCSSFWCWSSLGRDVPSLDAVLFVYLLMWVDGDEWLVGGHVFLGLSKRLQFTWEIFCFFKRNQNCWIWSVLGWNADPGRWLRTCVGLVGEGLRETRHQVKLGLLLRARSRDARVAGEHKRPWAKSEELEATATRRRTSQQYGHSRI